MECVLAEKIFDLKNAILLSLDINSHGDITGETIGRMAWKREILKFYQPFSVTFFRRSTFIRFLTMSGFLKFVITVINAHVQVWVRQKDRF